MELTIIESVVNFLDSLGGNTPTLKEGKLDIALKTMDDTKEDRSLKVVRLQCELQSYKLENEKQT